jgi:hypothetical protein
VTGGIDLFGRHYDGQYISGVKVSWGLFLSSGMIVTLGRVVTSGAGVSSSMNLPSVLIRVPSTDRR